MNGFYREPWDMSYPLDAATAIEVGDHLWWDAANATLKPIGGSATNLVRTWASASRAIRDAVARYAGVADFLNLSTDFARNAINVRSNNVVRQLTVSSATFKRGDLLGPFKDAGGNYLNRNTLEKKNDPRDAVAMVMEDYTSATTTVLALVFSSVQRAELLSRIKIFPFYIGTVLYAAGGTIVEDFTFGMPIRLFNANLNMDVVAAGDGVVTLKNGANSLDDTIAIPNTTAPGVIISQDIDDANDYDVFDHDDALDIAVDATPTGGSFTLRLMGLLQAPQV